jgi:hypothetical protein
MKYLFVLLILSFFSCFLFAQKPNDTDNSKRLIERYNKLRSLKSLPQIKHDSILDIVTNEVFANDIKYRKSFNSFNEDSIRFLLYNKGIIDYKYALIETADNDTISSFEKFFMSDASNNILCGYARKDGKNLILKTKNYLEYGYAVAYISSETGNYMQETFKIFTDSVEYHVKAVVPGKYKFYYSEKIPLKSELSKDQVFFDIRTGEATNHPSGNRNFSDFNLVIKSKYPDKFIVITNRKNGIVAVIK